MACWYRQTLPLARSSGPEDDRVCPAFFLGPGPAPASARLIPRLAGRPRFERQLESAGRAGEVVDVVDVHQAVGGQLVDLREQLVDGALLVLGQPGRVAELAQLVVDLGQVGEQNGGRIHAATLHPHARGPPRAERLRPPQMTEPLLTLVSHARTLASTGVSCPWLRRRLRSSGNFAARYPLGNTSRSVGGADRRPDGRVCTVRVSQSA